MLARIFSTRRRSSILISDSSIHRFLDFCCVVEKNIRTRSRHRIGALSRAFAVPRNSVVTIANPCYAGHHRVKGNKDRRMVRALWERARSPPSRKGLFMSMTVLGLRSHRRSLCVNACNARMQFCSGVLSCLLVRACWAPQPRHE